MSTQNQVGPVSLIPLIASYKVSTVLNNDRKVYGKKFLIDGKDETCWNSDQGLPQWIHLKFTKPVTISQLNIQFQGGFAGKDCSIQVWTTDEHDKDKSSGDNDQNQNSYLFTPNDSNSVQEIPIPNESRHTADEFRLIFKSSTDFYGRVIIYQFDIIGFHNE